VAKLSAEELQRLAKLGAAARLEQLRAEEAAIRAAFPDLAGRGPRGRRAGAAAAVAPVSGSRRRRPAMSAAGRKAVSERMRKYWAERRKTKTAAKATK
jgi:hypothetical protein